MFKWIWPNKAQTLRGFPSRTLAISLTVLTACPAVVSAEVCVCVGGAQHDSGLVPCVQYSQSSLDHPHNGLSTKVFYMEVKRSGKKKKNVETSQNTTRMERQMLKSRKN